VPNDVDLLQQTALYYQTNSSSTGDSAARTLAQAQPATAASFARPVPLYFQNKQEDKALELADQLLKENPSDMTTIWAIGNLLQQNGKLTAPGYLRERDGDRPRMKPNL
jgi:hypothetical protein